MQSLLKDFNKLISDFNAPVVDVKITFQDKGGVSRVLQLRMPHAEAKTWVEGLRALEKFIRSSCSPSFWRWAHSCMAATSERGARGFLHQSEVRSLLRCANADSLLTDHWLNNALDDIVNHANSLPPWLRLRSQSNVNKLKLLNAPMITQLLLRLSTDSHAIAELFNTYAVSEKMTLDEWTSFVRNEQLGIAGQDMPDASDAKLDEENDVEFQTAVNCYKAAAAADYSASSGLNVSQFALLLIYNLENEAVVPIPKGRPRAELPYPLAHYWTASSHNSYIVGDQLTGISSADAYRRQLLQVELPSWATTMTQSRFDDLPFGVAGLPTCGG